MSSAEATSLYPVSAEAKAGTYCTAEQYQVLYKESVDDPEAYWMREGKRLDWLKPYTKAKNTNFSGDAPIRWFEDGALNVSANCIDRHLADRSEQTAIIWEADTPGITRHITYRELHNEVCRMANVLKSHGVSKGDRVTIYLPMIPEAAYAMLACARIGAVHSVVFGGFSPDALAGRIQDCESAYVITADAGMRGGKQVPLKANVDAALGQCPNVKNVLVVRHTGAAIDWCSGRDLWWHEASSSVAETCPAEVMEAEDALFILYTSGSTGKPKGVLHTTGGYLLWAAMTFHYVFEYKPGEIFWCTADVGWVTGHSYVVYGPLANGGTTLMFEGVPNYPDVDRFWCVIDTHKVNIFYTAPTALRALMREGNAPVEKHSLQSLRLLGSVGEPINPEAWAWYHRVVGKAKLPIVDTWWQTETGGIMISPLPGSTALKPGSATRPFFGIKPALVDEHGVIKTGATEGNLVILDSWPGQARSIYGDHARFVQTYFSTYPGTYFTGDGCRRDADDYYWITGRVDDVINVSGHRMGTAEVESALVSHPDVAEAAVVGYPHDIKGQAIYAYVTLNADVDLSPAIVSILKLHVRKEIGAIATPDIVHLTPGLPKTRSGKIMRRILRKIAEGETGNLGDISTLADPSVVQSLIETRIKN